jgi:hypothetical protein
LHRTCADDQEKTPKKGAAQILAATGSPKEQLVEVAAAAVTRGFNILAAAAGSHGHKMQLL